MQQSNLADSFDKDHKQINQTMFFNQTQLNNQELQRFPPLNMPF